MSLRPFATALFVLAGGALASSLPACGSADATNADFGAPPDAATFNPGQGGNDPYGYGQGESPEPFVCPEALKRCSHTFTYPDSGESSVELRGDFGGPSTWEAGKPMTKSGGVWSVDVNVPFGGAVQYKFVLNGTQWTIDPAQPTVTDAEQNTNNFFAGKTCEPAVCEEQGALPAGVFDWRDSVLYFVFVDRFFNGNVGNDCTVGGVSGGPKSIANYQGGDWAGVTQKINAGYFNELGVNTLWVTVPFENPNVAGKGVGGDNRTYSAYHGYWPKLDSDNAATLGYEGCFGTEAEFKALVDAAHQKGLKVLIDYAMVHVHSSSSVYQQHSGWFWPNNCICGQNGCDWNADGHRCWFTDYLPHWNYTVKEARDFAVANAVEWVKQTGVDGFRADAIKHVDISWLTSLRAKLATDVHATQSPRQRFYMVGETYDFGNRDLLRSFVDPTDKLDGQFDFPLRKEIVERVVMRLGTMGNLADFMNSNDYFYGPNAIMSTWIGNHDLPRIIHLAANNRLWGDQYADGKDRAWTNQPGAVGELEAYERVANGFAVIFTNRGAPLVYYGDEIGMPGAGDPDNRRFMQWDGLSQNQVFLRDRVKKLLDIRGRYPALRRGTRSTLETTNDLWAYSMQATGEQTVHVVVNRGDGPSNVTKLPAGALTELVTGADVTGPTVSIPPRQTRIFVAK